MRQASVAGHPGGHPAVADRELWAALAAKTAALGGRELAGDVKLHFNAFGGFSATVEWIESRIR